MTPLQKTFNIVVVHSRKMTEQSINRDGTCVYRHISGNACFIGGTLPDELYQPEMESREVRELLDIYPEVVEYYKNQGMTISAYRLEELQYIHDVEFDVREEKLRAFAIDNNLIMPE